MKIAVIGTGYVGLVSGVCFAEFGHDVVCVDKLPEKIAMLERAEVPIYEPGLDELLKKNVAAQRLRFTTDLAAAVPGVDAVFIAVGTPSRASDGHADLGYVMAAARDVGRALTSYAVVVTKSTVPLGANRKVAKAIHEAAPHAEFDLASNPEFLREGAAIGDFMKPDRVVVGVETERARDVLERIYAPVSKRGFPVVFTGIETAETIKYAANAFLATKISFINEIAALCEHAGADVDDVAHGIGLDKRIGAHFLQAGPGYGGSCFPKDTKALIHIGQEYGCPMRITQTVVEVNEAAKNRMVDKIRKLCDGDVSGKKIAVLGVTFKAETDDMRDAPSLTIIPALLGDGARLCVCDPQGLREGKHLFGDTISWSDDAYSAAHGADLVVLLTEWDAFKSLDLVRLAAQMRSPRMADLRNLYKGEAALEAGFTHYDGVGRAALVI